MCGVIGRVWWSFATVGRPHSACVPRGGVVRHRTCFTARPISTSLWKRGMLARSPKWECAAAHTSREPVVLGWMARARGPLPLEHSQVGRARPIGVAQGMFASARAFNQPVEAWHVDQVTSMDVRHHLGLEWFYRGRSYVTGAPTRRALARRSVCSCRPISTSRWLRGTLVRSTTWRCALRPRVGWDRLGWLATPTHSRVRVQEMFRRCHFNQPLAAWDVGQVTDMKVRRRPCLLGPEGTVEWLGRGGGPLRPEHPRARAVWYGAVDVRLRGRFQPARGCVGRWPGHRHASAPSPPRVLIGSRRVVGVIGG